MKYTPLVLAVFLFFASHSTAQIDPRSAELAEAERLSVEVVNLYQAGEFKDALPLAERALALREKNLGRDHKLVAAALRNLAEVQFARRKGKDAEATYERYLDVYAKTTGEEDPGFINALDRYVCLLVGEDRRDKALDVQKRIFRLDNKFDYPAAASNGRRDQRAGGLVIGTLRYSPPPAYLLEARQAGISGSVVFKVTVDETGSVSKATVLCGHPLLVKGSEHSIRQMRFEPMVISGKPTQFIGIGIYNFIRPLQ